MMIPQEDVTCHLLSKGGQDKSKSDSLDETGDGLDGSVLERSSLSEYGADDSWNGRGTKDDQSEVGGSLVGDSSGQLEKSGQAVSLETGGDEGSRVDGDGRLSLLCLPELGVLVLQRRQQRRFCNIHTSSI